MDPSADRVARWASLLRVVDDIIAALDLRALDAGAGIDSTVVPRVTKARYVSAPINVTLNMQGAVWDTEALARAFEKSAGRLRTQIAHDTLCIKERGKGSK